MKQKIKSGLAKRFLSEENYAKYDHMLDKQAENEENLKTGMISHLSALNDGVIAIFITVMMLEIPIPSSKEEYMMFAQSILVFLVSFFNLADFWYDNKRIFETIRKADHMVVVADFIFLASLALIPVTTKWILIDRNRYSVLNFGLVYFVALLSEQFLFYTSLRDRFKNHMKLFFSLILARIGFLMVVNMINMIIVWFVPELGMIFYIILPAIDFFRPTRVKKGDYGQNADS